MNANRQPGERTASVPPAPPVSRALGGAARSLATIVLAVLLVGLAVFVFGSTVENPWIGPR